LQKQTSNNQEYKIFHGGIFMHSHKMMPVLVTG